jgi:opacity protein-like surface antigen
MKISLLTVSAISALMLASTASAQQQSQPNILEQLFGNVFGNSQVAEQTLESDWNQGRRPFEQRREQLDARIDAAVRDGALSRNEADSMHREYEDIVRLEAQYSANGPMQPQQRDDLRTRYRALSQRVGYQNNGQSNAQNNGQYGGQYGQPGYQTDDRWQPLAQQNSLFEQRLGEAVRNRSLTQYDATRLRSEWRALGQLEQRYQYNGLDAREEADLRARYAQIDSRMGGMLTGGFGNDRNIQRWAQMETRLQAAQRAGRMNAAQAVQMRAQMGDLQRLDAAYGRTGYSAEQRSYLTRRYGELDSAIGYSRR